MIVRLAHFVILLSSQVMEGFVHQGHTVFYIASSASEYITPVTLASHMKEHPALHTNMHWGR